MYETKLLSVFCERIFQKRFDRALKYLCVDVDDYNFYNKYYNLQPILFTFYSLYQYCRIKNININNIITDSEKNTIFKLITTLDVLNIEVAKQLLLIKIRQCTISK